MDFQNAIRPYAAPPRPARDLLRQFGGIGEESMAGENGGKRFGGSVGPGNAQPGCRKSQPGLPYVVPFCHRGEEFCRARRIAGQAGGRQCQLRLWILWHKPVGPIQPAQGCHGVSRRMGSHAKIKGVASEGDDCRFRRGVV